MIQLGKFVGGGVGWVGGWLADTNYLYPARWGWIKKPNWVLGPSWNKNIQMNEI